MESIIPGEAGFSPLSFIFWRGIIWTPEMWGKGLAEELFFGGVFGYPFWDPAWVPKWVKKLLIFGFNFRLFFGAFGAPWVPLGSLLGPLEAFLGGLWTPKTLKQQIVF